MLPRAFLATDLDVPLAQPVVELAVLGCEPARMRRSLRRRDEEREGDDDRIHAQHATSGTRLPLQRFCAVL